MNPATSFLNLWTLSFDSLGEITRWGMRITEFSGNFVGTEDLPTISAVGCQVLPVVGSANCGPADNDPANVGAWGPIPEPSSMLLALLGLAVLGLTFVRGVRMQASQ